MKKKVMRRAAVKLAQELAAKQHQIDVLEAKLEMLNDQLTDALDKLREQDTPTRAAMQQLKATMSAVLPEDDYQPIPRLDASGAYNPQWTYKKDGTCS